MTNAFSQLVTALRNVPVRQFIVALERDGFAQQLGTIGSHQVYEHTDDGRRAVVAFHKGSDTLPRKTLESLLRATEWNQEDAKVLGLLKR